MAPPKRKLSSDDSDDDDIHSTAITVSSDTQLAKRSRVTDIVPVNDDVLAVNRTNARTSHLASPTMLLTGHSAAIYSMKFDPSGEHIASSSFDRSICELLNGIC